MATNTYAQFPNIDDLTSRERGMFIKEHEFQELLKQMLTELENLAGTSGDNSNEIDTAKELVTSALNDLQDKVTAFKVNVIQKYINNLVEDSDQVQAAFERLYSKIHEVIQGINVNIQNRTITYDVIVSYKIKILDSLNSLIGVSSPYQSGKTIDEEYSSNYDVTRNDVAVHLRDVDDGAGFVTNSVLIDPNVEQTNVIKLFDFDPIAKSDKEVPSFLAEVIISGDLFAFKGYLKSTEKNNSGERIAVFDADYLINQDLPYSFKVLRNKTNGKIALALKFDETDDNFTSVVKFDISVNILVGTNLNFYKNTLVTSVDLNTHNVNCSFDNGIGYYTDGQIQQTVTDSVSDGNSYVITLTADTGYEVPSVLDGYFDITVDGVSINQTLVTYSPSEDRATATIYISHVYGNLVITGKPVTKGVE